MLPVIIYDPTYAGRSEMMTLLHLYAEERELRFSVLENTSDPKETEAALRNEPGITLCLLGTGTTERTVEKALELGRLADSRNRDNYTVYWLGKELPQPILLRDSIHVTGFVTYPPTQKQFDRIMDWVLSDYRLIGNDEAENFLALQNGSSVFRLPVSKIDYIEALDKKLNVWTNRQCISTYERLVKMEETLGQRFFRCHRSYLVQRAKIAKADYERMELVLINGARLPLSRSAKERLKSEMLAEELLS